MAYINSLARIQIEVMMHRLFTAAALILLLISCQSTDPGNSYLEMAEGLYGEEAEALYSQALGETDNAAIYYNLAYSHLQQGEFREAAAVADEALAIYPDMIRFMYLKAYALRESGRYLSYERMLHSILAFDPGNDDIRQLLLDHYLDTGRRSDAAAVGRDMIARDSDNSSALTALGFISDFFAAIAPSRSNGFKPEGRLWSEPPFIYQNLGILRGERLLRDVKREITPPPLSSSTP